MAVDPGVIHPRLEPERIDQIKRGGPQKQRVTKTTERSHSKARMMKPSPSVRISLTMMVIPEVYRRTCRETRGNLGVPLRG